MGNKFWSVIKYCSIKTTLIHYRIINDVKCYTELQYVFGLKINANSIFKVDY